MSTNPITPAQADMLRTAVQAKIAYWEALRAIEIELGGELSNAKDRALWDSVDGLAATVDAAEEVSNDNAQEVFDAVRRA